MIGAGIEEGHILLVEPNAPLNSGDKCLCLTEDGATVKTYKYKDGVVTLMPHNPKYDAITFTPDEADQRNIRFFRITRKLKDEPA